MLCLLWMLSHGLSIERIPLLHLLLMLDGGDVERIASAKRWSASWRSERHLPRRSIHQLLLRGKIVDTAIVRGEDRQSVATLRSKACWKGINLGRGSLGATCRRCRLVNLEGILSIAAWSLLFGYRLTNEQVIKHLLSRCFSRVKEVSELALFLSLVGRTLSWGCHIGCTIEDIVKQIAIVVLTRDPSNIVDRVIGHSWPRVEKLVDFVQYATSVIFGQARCFESQTFKFSTDLANALHLRWLLASCRVSSLLVRGLMIDDYPEEKKRSKVSDTG